MTDNNNKDDLSAPGMNRSMGSESTSGDFRSRISGFARSFDDRYHVRDRFQGVSSRFQENSTWKYAGIAVLGVSLGFGVWALARYFSERREASELVHSVDDTYTV